MIVGMKSDKNQPLSGQKLLAQFHTKRWVGQKFHRQCQSYLSAPLETFSKSLRVELAGQGVRVSTVRVGHLHRVDDSPLDDETFAEMMKVFEETGFAATTGQGMEIDTVTAALVNLLTLPADATMDLLELRSRN